MAKMTRSEAGRLGAEKSRLISAVQKQKRIDLYNLNPLLCKRCSSALSYEDKKMKKVFCSHSCSAMYFNKKHQLPKCVVCNTEAKTLKAKYCSVKCQQEKIWLDRKNIIHTSGVIFGDDKEHDNRVARRFLKETKGVKCSICNTTEWQGQEVPLVMDHIDGNSTNWKVENLRLVCGNCDMQLPTYKAKNKGNGRAWRKQRYDEGKSY